MRLLVCGIGVGLFCLRAASRGAHCAYAMLDDSRRISSSDMPALVLCVQTFCESTIVSEECISANAPSQEERVMLRVDVCGVRKLPRG